MIKKSPEDFVVMEITGKGVALEPGMRYSPAGLSEEPCENGEFTTFVLEKKSWDTINALIKIAGNVNRGRKSISYAGTKDKVSVSVQLASIYGTVPEMLERVMIKDININGAWKSREAVSMGSNLGNKFRIRVSGADFPDNAEKVLEELGGRFPNYFDRQRFGYRMNNAKIGMHILGNELECAAMEFLTGTSNESNPDAIEARKKLAEEQDFVGALTYFPRYLRAERAMIAYLAKEKNYANAFIAMPRGLSIMFIHAVEAEIFNKALEERIKANDFETGLSFKQNFYGFPDSNSLNAGSGDFIAAPLIGYETKETEISSYEKEILESMKISKSDFKIRSLPQLSMKGAYRSIFSPIKDASYAVEGSDSVNVSFSIPAGSYATILMGEIIKTSNPAGTM